MPTIDVARDALATVIEILDRHISDRDVRVFGSRVAGRAKPFSDLDLVTMGERALDLCTLSRLRNDFDESDLPFRVDLIEWASASESFRRMIAAQAVPLRPTNLSGSPSSGAVGIVRNPA